MNSNLIIPGFKDVVIHELKSIKIALYELNELYKTWQRNSMEEKNFTVVKAGLLAFYHKVVETQNSAFLKAIKTFKSW